MNKAIICIIVAVIQLQAQNLVPNPGFEEYIECPVTTGTLKDCKYWYDPVPVYSSCDHFNQCGEGVPNNFAGKQDAHGGEGYVGLGGGDDDWEEFIEVELSSPLKAGSAYKVSFWISRAENFDWAASSVGVMFSTDTLGNCFDCYRRSVPDVRFNGIFSDNLNWIKLEKIFIAGGGEQYLTIGYFDLKGTNKTPVGNSYGSYYYYYIDDVEVVLLGNNGEP